MADSNNDFNPFDPTGMIKGMRDANMDAWSKMMIDIVNTDAYATSTGAMLDAWLTSSAPFRKALEDSMAQALAQLNLPSRDDVTRLAERLTNIEIRLDDLDAKLDEQARQSLSGGHGHE
ncbi:MAG: hypothetical protein R3C10_11095 [Pirellulales bacterium]|nr:hypothetical protein [Planctomycetales bacterium]